MFGWIKRKREVEKKSVHKEENSRRPSVYSRITSALHENNTLPETFELEEQEEGAVRYAPGALEGILGHHTLGESENDQRLYDFLAARITQNPAMVLEELEQSDVFKNEIVVPDSLLQQLFDHREQIPAESLYTFAIHFVVSGTKEFTVKLGLTLLMLFNTNENEELKKVLLDLAAWEGFTDYIAKMMSQWDEKNTYYFQLAKRVSGWGKINAVEQLEPETEEIKHWILCEGCKNNVMYNYLAWICMEKSNLRNLIEQRKLTNEELNGAKDIVEGLIEEEPCAGISSLEKPYEFLYSFTTQYESRKLYIRDIRLFKTILDYINEQNDADNIWVEKIVNKIDEYVTRIDLKQCIVEALYGDEKGSAIELASKYEIDISTEYMELLRTEFTSYYMYIFYLLDAKKYVKEAIKVCEENLVYEQVATGMGNIISFAPTGSWDVSMVVQYLDQYPHCGETLIKASIHSPNVRYRNMAARALQGWTDKLNMPLKDISSDLYTDVNKVYKIEVDEKLREEWEKLIG